MSAFGGKADMAPTWCDARFYPSGRAQQFDFVKAARCTADTLGSEKGPIRRSLWTLQSPTRTTGHAFMVRVIVYSRSMPRTPDAASESADTGTYRRSRSRASRQRSDAGA